MHDCSWYQSELAHRAFWFCSCVRLCSHGFSCSCVLVLACHWTVLVRTLVRSGFAIAMLIAFMTALCFLLGSLIALDDIESAWHGERGTWHALAWPPVASGAYGTQSTPADNDSYDDREALGFWFSHFTRSAFE